MLTVAAAAAIAAASPMVQKASAAENTTTVQKKVYVYQSSNFEELNSYLQKYFASLGYKTTTNTTVQPSAGQTSTVEQPVTNQPTAGQTTTVEQPTTTQPPAEQQTTTLSAFEQKVVDLTNQERAKSGLAPLTIDTELSKVAREKSLDMSSKGYFSHTSPTYGSPFDMMKTFGITYKSAGENIAMGQRTPEEVVTAWMNSEGHRKNILSANFTHIGVGYSEQGNYWTQMFIGK